MASAEPIRSRKSAAKRRFPWLALLLLAASTYVFWILPRQLPDRPVQVEFAKGR